MINPFNIFLGRRAAALKAAQPAAKSAKDSKLPASPSPSLISRIIKRNESQTRRDIGDWQLALSEAKNIYSRRQARLQYLYTNITTDALLSSQINLRIDRTQASSFSLQSPDGVVDASATAFLKDTMLYDTLADFILQSKFFSHSLVELGTESGHLEAKLIPRTHVFPSLGRFYPEPYNIQGTDYRLLPEYGTWLLEFGATEQQDFGILNTVVPHVLMKRFAQSCWSELCEVYGIPPMVVKTNTQDPDMLQRLKEMFAQQGSNSKFITDVTEEVEWASGVATDGAVFSNLISLCNSEISLSILGAVLGQDTINGNRSKEESSSKLLDSIVNADRRFVEASFNQKVLPALAALGFIPQGLVFRFAQETDLSGLWSMTAQAANFFSIDPSWVKSTFGIQVTGAKDSAQEGGTTTNTTNKAANSASASALNSFFS